MHNCINNKIPGLRLRNAHGSNKFGQQLSCKVLCLYHSVTDLQTTQPPTLPVL
jgi:hypothetical protein